MAPARRELREAVTYYNEEKPGLGRCFALEVKSTISRIKAHPLLWTKISRRLRRCRLKKFPYSLLYYLEGERIIIVVVMHDQRNPTHWQRRDPV